MREMGFTMLVSENNRTAPYRFSQLASGRQRLSDFHWARRTDGICPAESLTERTTTKGAAMGALEIVGAVASI